MTASRVLTIAGAAGMWYLAARAQFQPREAAAAFGVALPADASPTPFLSVKADRDAAVGAMLLVVAASADARTLGAVMLCAAIAPLADAAIVARYGRRRDTAVHIGAVAYILATAWLATSGR